jgi:hypothetical protein
VELSMTCLLDTLSCGLEHFSLFYSVVMYTEIKNKCNVKLWVMTLQAIQLDEYVKEFYTLYRTQSDMPANSQSSNGCNQHILFNGPLIQSEPMYNTLPNT